MASAPFPGSWSPDAAFTGNSGFVIDTSGTIWLVGESTTTGGAALFKSTNSGITFNQVAAIPNTESTGLAFDAAVALDASGNIHFVGQIQSVSQGVELVKYEWNATSSALTGPFTITMNGVVGADYDIVCLSNGHCYVVSCLLTASAETIEGIEIDASGTVIYTDSLISQGLEAGNRYGSVSLWTPDGAAVEIYFESHPKVYSYKGITATLSLILRSAPDTVGSATTLKALTPIQYIDPNLTVVGNGNARYVSLGYYTQAGSFLVGNVLIGYLATADGSVWSFNTFVGTPQASYVQPVLALSSTNLAMAYLVKNFTLNPPVDSTVKLANLDVTTFSLTARPDFPYQATATYLRGSRSLFPTSDIWGFTAQRVGDGTARFFTGFNAPPVAVISPSTINNAVKGTTYNLDASGSFSPNLDALVFSWSVDDPTSDAIFTPEGEQAIIKLPTAAGPDAVTITVTVSVTAVDSNGDQLHSPVTATATLNYPQIAPPVITSVAPIAVARNAQETFTPTVTGNNPLSYLWAQSSGTALKMLSSPNAATIVFDSNGAAVAGESIGFTLTVSDGMNSPVSQAFTFDVAARTSDPSISLWRQTTFSNNIAGRNTTGTWPTGTPTSYTTNFFSGKRAPLVGGNNAYILIGFAEVLVQIAEDATTVATYTVLLPNFNDSILDAVHSDFDGTLVLTQSGLVQLLLPNPSLTDTDNAQSTAMLSSYTGLHFSNMTATPSFNGTRVIALWGSQGVFLMEVETEALTVVSYLELTVQTGFLYGANEVTFVRLGDVENLRSGQVLVGTTDGNGNYYETQISLVTQTIVGTWDSATVTDPTISTGELLFMPSDSYAGQPLAPVMGTPSAIVQGTWQLSWTQTRSDLVNGYYVFISLDGQPFTLYQTLNSGQSTSLVATGLLKGQTYQFNVQAQSDDGPSPVSNSVTINA